MSSEVKKRKYVSDSEGDEDREVGKPRVLKYHKLLPKGAPQKMLYVVLEGASVETVKVKNGYELLNVDDHSHILKKHGIMRTECRPDITRQCLLKLLDSPLNKANLMRIYIHTTKNVLIEVNPQIRMFRTFKRFCDLMVFALHKMRVRGKDTKEKLLKIVQGPVTDHFPPGIQIFGLEYSSDVVNGKEKAVRPIDILPDGDKPVAIIIGAMAKGSINRSYAEKLVSISAHPLSASECCSQIADACERKWGIH